MPKASLKLQVFKENGWMSGETTSLTFKWRDMSARQKEIITNTANLYVSCRLQ